MNMRTHSLARSAVKLAATHTSDRSIKSWLNDDPAGSFEMIASGYLEDQLAKERASKLGLSQEQFVEQVSLMVALAAIKASTKRGA